MQHHEFVHLTVLAFSLVGTDIWHIRMKEMMGIGCVEHVGFVRGVGGGGGMKRESLSNQFKNYRQTYP